MNQNTKEVNPILPGQLWSNLTRKQVILIKDINYTNDDVSYIPYDGVDVVVRPFTKKIGHIKRSYKLIKDVPHDGGTI